MTATLLCAAALAAAAQLAPDSTATNNVRWGETTNGLQMGICVEPSFGVVHCWLRNGETNEIAYNNWSLSGIDWSQTFLEMRDGTNWLALSRAPAKFRCQAGVGPAAFNNKTLQPQELIAPLGGGVAERRFSEWVTNKAGGGHFSSPTPPVPGSHQATMLVDLLDFNWPQAFLHQRNCEARIRHSFVAWQATYNSAGWNFFDVYSPVFSLGGTAVKGLLDQLPRAVTNKGE
ncbi:MAG: hypothetical protein ABSA47_06985 [Verrucomicrobiota bacterium]